ncbi:MAG: HAD-IA family hydrolase [Alphaproteobacteria bacterium]|jgi:HAD superfamily hydrolase (TIGR01509 family)|nr:HAD-IA family hydrolase [Alphaproteobacteria bacterium]MBP9867523.1 HAD-IA family hydrolase [Alphaproteobacteria bacterium]
MAYDLIIFDCDGTLSDSEYLNNKAVSEVLFDLGYSQYTIEYCFKNYVGRTTQAIRESVEKENGTKLPESFVDLFITKVNVFQAEFLKPTPNSVAAVESLAGDFRVCVASNGEPELVESSVRAIGLGHIFSPDQIFTKELVERGKPAPDLFLYAAARMGVSSTKTIVIEDTPTGAKAGLAAGMYVIGYTGVSHAPEVTEKELKTLGVTEAFSSWPEIVAHIRSLQRAVTA